MKRAFVILLATTVAASAQVQYAFTNLAGLPGGLGSVDGTAGAARFNYPSGVAVDSAGNVYVADSGNSTIRKITPDGTVTTLAGSAGQSGSADGTGSAARFNNPSGVAVDSLSNLYVADSGNGAIRKITPAGVVTTLAGSAARFSLPSGVAVDNAGNVFVADRYNQTIRKISPDGEITTLAGSAGQSGRADGTGNAARFNEPSGVAVDSAGNLYVAEFQNSTIRKITPTGVVTTLAFVIYNPFSVAVDCAGGVYVADTFNHTIGKVTPGGSVTTLAGSPGQIGNEDGIGSAARFGAGGVGPYFDHGPYGVAADCAGNIYVADTYNHTIRKISPAAVVTTLAGTAGYGSANGIGSAARFNQPWAVAVDSADNVYVSDFNNYTIRKITANGLVTTLAGSAGQHGSADGTGSEVRFGTALPVPAGGLVPLGPGGVAVDGACNIYVADTGSHTIRKITPAGMVTTLAGSAGQSGSADGVGNAARFYGPTSVAVDTASNIYVADSSNHTIRKITPDGAVTTLAGSAGYGGSADGIGSAARFGKDGVFCIPPCGPTGVAMDSSANLYVADSDNHTIRKVTPDGVVTTLAGSAGQQGSEDGNASAARFNFPTGVAVDNAGNLYVADSGNHTIREITPAGAVTTLAGTAGQIGWADGVGSAAQFDQPRRVAVDIAGNLYVSDSGNNRISKGTPVFRFDASTGSVTVSNGLFHVRLTGPFASHVVVESSASFQAWTPVQTNALLSGVLDLLPPLGTNQSQFFRARLAP